MKAVSSKRFCELVEGKGWELRRINGRENEDGKFLKTIISSRKATRDYLGGKNG